jgi:hypothetical protein
VTRAALLALAACAHAAPAAAPAPPPAQAPTPAPTPTPPPPDPCAQEAARIQPLLDANLALFTKWGAAVELDGGAIPPATADLEPITARMPIIIATPKKLEMLGLAGPARSIAYRVRALFGRDTIGTSAVALAVSRDTPWIEVVELLHALQLEGLGHVKFVFAVDRTAVRVPDNPIAEKLRADHASGGVDAAHDIGVDFGQRCAPVASLFQHLSVETLQRFAHEAGPALASCHCAVSPTEVASLYAAVMVPHYVAARTLALSRTGTEIAVGRSATFADATRWIVGLAPDAPATFAVH